MAHLAHGPHPTDHAIPHIYCFVITFGLCSKYDMVTISDLSCKFLRLHLVRHCQYDMTFPIKKFFSKKKKKKIVNNFFYNFLLTKIYFFNKVFFSKKFVCCGFFFFFFFFFEKILFFVRNKIWLGKIFFEENCRGKCFFIRKKSFVRKNFPLKKKL